jgi:predicted protein tyrosine phosphatase
VTSFYALIPVDEVLVEWADEIVCASAAVAAELDQHYKLSKPITILRIPDQYECMQPELIDHIQRELIRVGFKPSETD